MESTPLSQNIKEVISSLDITKLPANEPIRVTVTKPNFQFIMSPAYPPLYDMEMYSESYRKLLYASLRNSIEKDYDLGI